MALGLSALSLSLYQRFFMAVRTGPEPPKCPGLDHFQNPDVGQHPTRAEQLEIVLHDLGRVCIIEQTQELGFSNAKHSLIP